MLATRNKGVNGMSTIRHDTSESAWQLWIAKVDMAIGQLCGGLSHDDLPDCCYRDWFNDGVSPLQAAKRAITNAMEC